VEQALARRRGDIARLLQSYHLPLVPIAEAGPAREEDDD
jgi:hypothetical protein